MKPRDWVTLADGGDDEDVRFRVTKRCAMIEYAVPDDFGDPGKIILTFAELAALREILNDGDPLSGFEVTGYRLDGDAFLVNCGESWAIERGRKTLSKSGGWVDVAGRLEDIRWDTPREAAEFWKARTGS